MTMQELTPEEEAEKERNIEMYRQRYEQGQNITSGKKLSGKAKKEWRNLQVKSEGSYADNESGGTGDS
tara:strand:+ start:253 stop:456 length:204 start_codon:yes stop_codon:yes gene_type:complete